MKSPGRRLTVALLSPFHGGSHEAWADGLVRHSRHHIRVHGLPARFWRWRMQGAALTLAAQLESEYADGPLPDLLVATDMLDLSALLAITRARFTEVPAVLYMHENQLTYPVAGAAGGMTSSARSTGIINLNSMAAADRVVFNSEFHRQSWFDALDEFLTRVPEPLGTDIVATTIARSQVVPVGIEVADLPLDPGPRRPLVVWNQRWEHDKNPGELVRLLIALAELSVDFEVALCGEQFGAPLPEFTEGISVLGDRVVHQGFLSRLEYAQLLGRARVVVSTAHHEFFGISVVEAVCAGAHPLLPNRLSYPEILGTEHRSRCLYDDFDDALARLRMLLASPDPTREVALAVAADLRGRFRWETVISDYDDVFAELAMCRD